MTDSSRSSRQSREPAFSTHSLSEPAGQPIGEPLAGASPRRTGAASQLKTQRSGQLTLPVRLRQEATFNNYLTGSVENLCPRSKAVASLQNHLLLGGEPFIYLWGSPGVGRTHLLQATCHALASQEGAQYLPLTELSVFPPKDLLEGMETLALVCLDDIQAIAGNPAWEQAVFGLFNRLRDQGGRLLVGADRAPRELPLTLPDLQSRLSWGAVFHLPAYSDDEKAAILQFRSARLGLEMSPEVARFIVHRAARDLSSLLTCLSHLDSASLELQRKLSIPLVKQVFGW